tara:strand:- start:260 stop:475 length:216 start_codon:yes stop_codon:yes gene_type:complete
MLIYRGIQQQRGIIMRLRKVTTEDGYVFYEQPDGSFTDGPEGQIDLMFICESDMFSEDIGIQKIEFYEGEE